MILAIFIVLQMVPHFVPLLQYLGHTQTILMKSYCSIFFKAGSLPALYHLQGGTPLVTLLISWFIIPITSSTAQGGGGSFKNRKPIGEVGCCESGMAERIH